MEQEMSQELKFMVGIIVSIAVLFTLVSLFMLITKNAAPVKQIEYTQTSIYSQKPEVLFQQLPPEESAQGYRHEQWT